MPRTSMPCLVLTFSAMLHDGRVDARAVIDPELPHVQVHGLGQARALQQRRVVRLRPLVEDQRLAVEPVDEEAGVLVVGGEAERADHAVALAVPQPLLGGVEQRAGHERVVAGLEPAEHPPLVVLELVEVPVVVGGDAADRVAVAAGEEVLGLGVLEERVLRPVKSVPNVELQRGNPQGLVTIDRPREVDEGVQVPPRGDVPDLYAHSARHPSPCKPPSTSSPRPATTIARPFWTPRATRTSSPTSARWSRRRAPWWSWRAPSGSCSAATTTSGSPRTSASSPAPATPSTATAPG